MIFLIFFLLGLIIGSFLNVLVYRLSLAETIMGRSHCPHCRTKVRWYDNIPLISFALLKAKCRDCGERISWQYPLVEFLTGIIFGITSIYFFDSAVFNSWVITLFYLGAFSILMVIFLYDLRFMEIPMIMIWIGVGWTLLFLIIFDQFNVSLINDITSTNTISGIIAGAVAFLFFFSLAYFSKEKWMGLGDGYVGLFIGLLVGWPNILFALMISFLVGAVVSILLMIFKGKNLQSQVPFAPFLVVGTLLAIFLNQALPKIWNWMYF